MPTALAVAEAVGASGGELLRATIAGIEITTRMYKAFYPTLKSYESVGIAPGGFANTAPPRPEPSCTTSTAIRRARSSR